VVVMGEGQEREAARLLALVLAQELRVNFRAEILPTYRVATPMGLRDAEFPVGGAGFEPA
jgi:hypothetical protein